jgi:hypothetical protein
MIPDEGLEIVEDRGSYERTHEGDKSFVIHQCTGDIDDVPEKMKRSLTVKDFERADVGDWIISRSGSKLVTIRSEFPLKSLTVKAADRRSIFEVDLSEGHYDQIFCPFCGEKMWEIGQGSSTIKNTISCGECRVYYTIYGKGEQIVLEGGP